MQTFGDLANFNPHVHVLAPDGVFRADGSFVALPPVPEAALEKSFQRSVLAFLAASGAISQALREKLLGWIHSGFSVHNQVCVDDTVGDDWNDELNTNAANLMRAASA